MWFRRKRGHNSSEEAEKALEEAKQMLKEVQAQSEEVTTIATDLRDIRERNHFAEQLEELIYNRRKPLHQ